MNIDNINFDNIDDKWFEDHKKEMNEINKSMKKLLKSRRVQKALRMMDLEKSLGFHDNRKLKTINVLDNSLEFVFKDKTSTVITIKELIKLYNYNKN